MEYLRISQLLPNDIYLDTTCSFAPFFNGSPLSFSLTSWIMATHPYIAISSIVDFRQYPLVNQDRCGKSTIVDHFPKRVSPWGFHIFLYVYPRACHRNQDPTVVPACLLQQVGNRVLAVLLSNFWLETRTLKYVWHIVT